MLKIKLIIFTILFLFISNCTESEVNSKQKVVQNVKGNKKSMKPVVSGKFYSDSPSELRNMIHKFLNDSKAKKMGAQSLVAENEDLMGIISPHAGYIYSGPIAAYSYNLIAKRNYKRIVIMAPSHHVHSAKISALDMDTYSTPLGNIPVDNKSIKKLISENDFIEFNLDLYNREHSLEVQLPFLQVLNNTPIIPLLIGTHDIKTLKKLASVLNKEFPKNDTLFIASSDLSHYHEYNAANELDLTTLDIVSKGDIEGLLSAVASKKAELCGFSPVYVLMELHSLYGGGKIKTLHYANSGDTAGDKNRVVGYGAVAFTLSDKRVKSEIKKDDLSKSYLTLNEKNLLLKLARNTVEQYIKERKTPNVDKKNLTPKLLQKGAAFVTLKKRGKLRGCIGHTQAHIPLYECIIEMAKAASTKDPRFNPVQVSELLDLHVEVSVLTPLTPINNPLDVVVGKHGLMMKRGFYSGLLLPQVPVEYGWSRNEFLNHTCKKAGLEKECWTKGNVKLLGFEAIVFGEE